MSNITVGFPTHTETAIASAWTGSWLSGWPVTNVTSLPLGRVARSSDADVASTKFQITLAADQPVGMVSLIGHNASNDATVEIQVYADAAGTMLEWQSGPLEFWPAVYDSLDLEFEDDRWFDGKYLDSEKRGNVPILPVLLGSNYSARLIRVSVIDPGNPDGFFQVGYVDVATAAEFTINFKYGAQYGLRDRTAVLESEGGAKYFNARGDVKIFRGEIDYLPETEALSRAYEMQRQLGAAKPFVVVLYPDKPETFLTQAFLARHAALDPISRAFFGRDTVPLNFEEVR
jgi:hypothetical protein